MISRFSSQKTTAGFIFTRPQAGCIENSVFFENRWERRMMSKRGLISQFSSQKTTAGFIFTRPQAGCIENSVFFENRWERRMMSKRGLISTFSIVISWCPWKKYFAVISYACRSQQKTLNFSYIVNDGFNRVRMVRPHRPL